MPMYKHLIGTAQDALSRAVRLVFPAPSGPINATLNMRFILCSLPFVRLEIPRELQSQDSRDIPPSCSLPSSAWQRTILPLPVPSQWAETSIFATVDRDVFRQSQGSCSGETWI